MKSDTRFSALLMREMPTALLDRVLEFKPVGSRRTCNPAPTDTDNDFLVLVRETDSPLTEAMIYAGWQLGGSMPTAQTPVPSNSEFFSFTLEDINLIVTYSEEFYYRFMAATNVCRLLNVMDKAERIRIFQAALYSRFDKKAI